MDQDNLHRFSFFEPMHDKSRTAHDWLLSDAAVGNLVQVRRRLLELQKLLDSRFPELTLRVTQVERDTANLFAPSAASAAKARQSVPRLLEILKQAGWQISRIKIRPQREGFASQAPVFKVKRELSPAALTALREFRESVNDPLLEQAVNRMINRHSD